MKKSLKIVGLSLAGLAIVVGATATAAVLLSNRKMHRTVQVQIPATDLAAISPDLARGEYLFTTRGCSECHGADGGGRVAIDDASTGFHVFAPNITRGGSGAAATYSDTDWAAVIRHGLKPSRSPVFIMPSEDYAQMADSDLASLVAYIRNLPPAADKKAELRLPLPVKALYAFGAIHDAAEKIDHTLRAPAEAPDDTRGRGKYAAEMCAGCHGPGLAGGPIPGAPPSWPAAANLTSSPDSALNRYSSAESFRTMMRSGKRPDGTAIPVMPFESLRAMSDQELDALYGYLKSVPAKASGSR